MVLSAAGLVVFLLLSINTMAGLQPKGGTAPLKDVVGSV